jgi:hypothetical protein
MVSSPYLLHRRKAFRGGDAPWAPSDLTPALWLDASDNATLFNDTSGGSLPEADGGVARWEDKSGNARHLTQSTSGLRPIRKIANQNSLDGVQFNSASTHWIENASATFGLINRTAFIVFKENTAVANSGLLIIKPTAGQNDFGSTTGYILTPSNRTTARFIATGSTSSSYEILDASTPSTILPATIYGEVKSSGTGTLYRNGTSTATDSSFTEFSATSGGGVSLGARYLPSRSAPYLNGVIYEIVYCESALSIDDRQKLEGYLAHKWGLAASLPGGHPYISAPP